MIRKLQKRFIAIASLSFFIVMTTVVCIINIYNITVSTARDTALLEIIVHNEGVFPEMKRPVPPGKPPDGDHRIDITPETKYETRYFTVTYSDADGSADAYIGQIAAIGADDAVTYADRVIQSGKTSGHIGDYRFIVRENQTEKLVVFLDCTRTNDTIIRLLIVSCTAELLSFIVALVLTYIFSKKAIAPIIVGMEKQKRFITDAGHEIKTPLSIISANNEVLEYSVGNNEWLQSNRNQIERLKELIDRLLILARTEEQQYSDLQKEPFSLSEVTEECVEAMSSLAGSRSVKLSAVINPDIEYNGNRASISQLISLLTDNAIKYSPSDTVIEIRLSGTSRHPLLEFENDCTAPPEGDLHRLFDRFYRDDSARSRSSGGYGIGLSIANSIVEAHKGSINAVMISDKRILFSVVL